MNKKVILLAILLLSIICSTYSQQWTPSGTNIYNNNTGNVGIGTTNPLEKLNIHNGSLLLSADITSNYTMGTIKFSTQAYNYAWSGISGVSNGQGWDQMDLLFFTAYGGPSEKMRLMSSTGYLGVGTSSPSAKIHAMSNGEQLRLGYDAANFSSFTTSSTGGLTISPSGKTFILQGTEFYFDGYQPNQNQNSNSARLNFIGDGETAGFGIQALNTAPYGTKDLVFYAHNGIVHNDYTSYDEVVRFRYDGNVGIGTSTPQAKLDVRGSVSIGSNKLITLNPDYTGWGELPSGSYIGTNGTNSVTIAPSTDVASVGAKVVLGYASTNWWSALEVANVASGYSNMLLMKSGGNVGIGTSTPQTKLDVNGNIYSNGKIFIGTPDANTATQIAPYSLAVNGSAVFTKAVVKLNSAWPDYVFAPTYKLTQLDSIEHFIKINGHLPEIPKAETVAKDGIDLGSNQALLLKKIEELTLIVIEQNKRIEKLEETEKKPKNN